MRQFQGYERAVDVAEGGGRRLDNGHAGVGAHVKDVVEQRVGLLHQHRRRVEGLHTRGKFRSRGTQCGLCKLSHGRHTQSLRGFHKVSIMCKVCKWDLMDPEQILRSLPRPNRGARILGVPWLEGGHGPSGVRVRYPGHPGSTPPPRRNRARGPSKVAQLTPTQPPSPASRGEKTNLAGR